ncbi:MAG TPA: hypothetical protein PKH39_16880, partial [Woeseiaceae bacterium]|nr:hypothetical protein [Woeseiaceae bacterium]
MPAPRLGPALSATLCTPDLDTTVAAWRDNLHHEPVLAGTVEPERADAFGEPQLVGRRTVWLANAVGEPWLEVIESPGGERLDPFRYYGWYSLEINVSNVDGLRDTLDGNAFHIIGEPANLDVSDQIRAMQMIGTAGEVIYLSEIKSPVPPFELPTARSTVDRLFICVLFTEDRERTLAMYSELSGNTGHTFDTRITVINQAHDLAPDARHPVAALQLAGRNLLEIDQLSGLVPRPAPTGLPVGIAAIAFEVDRLPGDATHRRIRQGPH